MTKSKKDIIDTDDNLNQKVLLSAEERKSILRKRAEQMGAEIEDNHMGVEWFPVIQFVLSDETYAIESRFVREIYPLTEFTLIPGTPSFVLGVINIRGEIISVINLKKFFNLSEKGLGELNKVIILENSHMEFGILADVVVGNFRIATSDIQSVDNQKLAIGTQYLKGITKDHLILLDAEKMLTDPKMMINQEEI